jgi:hypothetical protein
MMGHARGSTGGPRDRPRPANVGPSACYYLFFSSIFLISFLTSKFQIGFKFDFELALKF